MNPAVRHFLPSVVRGVYRFDTAFASVETEDDLRRFTFQKLRFLPCDIADELRRRVTLSSDLETTERQIGFPIQNLGGAAAVAHRASTFFGLHDYFANANGQQADAQAPDNFLEIEFVRQILARLLNQHGLNALRPQHEVGQYRVDFALEGAAKFAFEVDGFAKFQSRHDLDAFLQRQNYIAGQGWRVVRYTHSQIMESTAATVREVHDLLKQDPQLRGFLNLVWTPNGLFDPTLPNTVWNAVDLVNSFYRIQDHAAEVAVADNLAELVVKDDFRLGFPFVAAAISSLFEFLEAVERLVDVRFSLPAVQVCGQGLPADWGPPLHALVTVSPFEAAGAQAFDQQNVLLQRAFLPVPPVTADGLSFKKGQNCADVRHGCQYFCSSVFGYEQTRPFQDRVLERVFDGQPVIGISATGSGKSFCFWLPALLKPGLTLVVCPLRSLMRDQVLALRNQGIASAELINSDVGAAAQRRIFNEAKLGYVRLLYISPERLRIRSFMQQLKQLQEVMPINLLAIDEAHCISEWGHDFRPAYLVLPQLHTALAQANPELGLIALTATAGQLVEQDMLNILKLRGEPGGDVVRDPGADRLRFSYQIIPVEPGTTKTAMFRRVLNEHLPKALRQPSLEQLLHLKHGDGDKAVGLVFCIYADPHGQHSTHDGIAHYLHVTKGIVEPYPNGVPLAFNEAAFSTGMVRGFSSKTPTLCPNPACRSYDYATLDAGPDGDDELLPDEGRADGVQAPPGGGQKQCNTCGRAFNAEDAVRPPRWDAVVRENQVAFKESRLDILVATKGFGMGIDKGSVRFVVHTALSSGLESWYQEVGRAGRDDQRAHIVLLFDPPTESCYVALREKLNDIPRPECTYRNCPHGRDSLCDYGKQHVFIKGSYPGAESDAIASLQVLVQLLAQDAPQVQVMSNLRGLSRRELAIYRLKSLGLIEDYEVKYDHPPRLTMTRASWLAAEAPGVLAELKSRMTQRLEQHFSHCTERAGRSMVQEIERVSAKFRELAWISTDWNWPKFSRF